MSDDRAWTQLSHKEQAVEARALTERALSFLEQLAADSPASDLPGYHAELIAEIRKQRADNARLRALVKAAERNGSGQRCPWCNVWEDEKHYMVPGGNPDYPDCPAFTPDGVVR